MSEPISKFDGACEMAYLCTFILALQPEKQLNKRIYGDAFKHDDFFIVTTPATANGLHSVDYAVVRQGGVPIGRGDSYAAALQQARLFLGVWSAEEQRRIHEFAIAQCEIGLKASQAKENARRLAWYAECEAREKDGAVEERDAARVARNAPKRKLEVFAKSNGKCHYCSAALTFDGKWHIEHKMPRALMGGDEPDNLVAACVPCNMKKSDTTDREFVARLSREAA